MSAPSWELKNKPSMFYLWDSFIPASCMAYFLTLKIEASYPSQMLVGFQSIMMHHIHEDRNIKVRWLQLNKVLLHQVHNDTSWRHVCMMNENILQTWIGYVCYLFS
jgi:hypothetical protein